MKVRIAVTVLCRRFPVLWFVIWSQSKSWKHSYPIAFISHTSKVMLKILQGRLQQYMNCELPEPVWSGRKENERCGWRSRNKPDHSRPHQPYWRVWLLSVMGSCGKDLSRGVKWSDAGARKTTLTAVCHGSELLDVTGGMLLSAVKGTVGPGELGPSIHDHRKNHSLD